VTFLLDTNVVSEMRRPSRLPEPVVAWFAAADADVMFLSVATLLEIEVGIRRLERRDLASPRSSTGEGFAQA